MRILEVEALLTNWFRACYNGNSLPWNCIDTSFEAEDGMSVQVYWDYEVENFKGIAKKYRLDERLYAKVHYWIPSSADINKNLVLVYVYNSENEFAFKVTMTICYNKYKYLISSNNSIMQVVAKHVINEDDKQVGLAILTPTDIELKEVFSKELKKVSLKKSPSFDGEEFYSVRFSVPEDFNHLVNNVLSFRICLHDKLKNTKIFETRQVILDAACASHKPYEIDSNGVVSILDNKLPVALMRAVKDDKELIAYPRNVESFNLNNYSSVIVTDVQDNDWVL